MSEQPDAVSPDTKDWTWVLARACPECGLDAARIVGTQAPAMVRDVVDRWAVVLGRAGARDRPAPAVWSPLEYACHVRDVFVVFDGRLRLMLEQDDPTFANWDQDVAAVEGRYTQSDPAVVSAELAVAGSRIAESFAAVGTEEWGREGKRSNGSQFTVETLAQYCLHDVVHHLHDVNG